METLEKQPETFRSDVGTIMWTPHGCIAVILPLSNRAVDVNLVERATGTTERWVWEPQKAIFVGDTKGLAVVKERIHYVYAVVKTTAIQ